MGYTHYFELEGKTKFREREVALITKMVEKSHGMIITAEGSPYIVNKDLIYFNGVDSCEDLYVTPKCTQYINTNRKPYDLPVCEVLLILKALNPTKCKIQSDGFWMGEEEYNLFKKTGVVKLGGTWNKALTNVQNTLNLKFKWDIDVSCPAGVTYYKFFIV